MKKQPFVGIVIVDVQHLKAEVAAFLFFPNELENDSCENFESYLLNFAPISFEDMNKNDFDKFVDEWQERAIRMSTYLSIEPQLESIEWD